MSAAEPLVTVVIPCFNQGRFVAEAIASVLAQTWTRREVIVVDDGSSDETPRVIAGFPGIMAIRQRNRGVIHARNRGLSLATGEFVVFLDADDRLLPHAIETGVRVLTRNAAAAYCGGRHRTITEDGKTLLNADESPPAADVYAGLLRRNLFTAPATVMFRTAPLREAKGFSDARGRCEDYELYLRLARRYPVVDHGELVGEYRRHEDSRSHQSSRMLASVLRILRRQKGVLRTPDRRRAYVEGWQFWRGYYGTRCLRELHVDLIERRLDRDAWHTLRVLVRNAPRDLAAYWTRARHSNSLAFRVGNGASASHRVGMRASRGGLLLQELMPAQVGPACEFQVQPSGLSAIAARCTGATPRTQIVMAGVLLDTEFADGQLLTGFVPRRLYANAGVHRVYLIDG